MGAPPLRLQGQLLMEQRMHTPVPAARGDYARLCAGWPTAAVLLLTGQDRVATTSAGELLLTPAVELAATPPREGYFLGVTAAQTDLWALYRPQVEHSRSLRSAPQQLGPGAAGSAAVGWALHHFHAAHPLDPRTGQPLERAWGGWSAHSGSGDGARELFPRIDPAIICLVHDGADQVLLGHNRAWPQGRMSLFAGFVDAGESFEAACVREVAEETGLAVSEVAYHGSQTWPFPRSLMVGMSAQADPTQAVTCPDGEITNTQWVSRTRLRALLAGEDTSLVLPGPLSIAHALLAAWADL